MQTIQTRRRRPHGYLIGLLSGLTALIAALAAHPAQAQTAGTDYLTTNAYLTEGQYLMGREKLFFLQLSNTGNLCFYGGSNVAAPAATLWCTNTGNNPAGQYFVAMQGDGNVCVYKGRPNANKGGVWCSMTNGAITDYSLFVTDDGRLLLYTGPSQAASTAMRVFQAPWSAAQVNTFQLSQIKPLTSSTQLNNGSRLMIQTTSALCSSSAYSNPTIPTPLYLNMIETGLSPFSASEIPAQRQFNNMYWVETVGTGCGGQKTFRIRTPSGQYINHAVDSCQTGHPSKVGSAASADLFYIKTINGNTSMFHYDEANCDSQYQRVFAQGVFYGGQGYCGSNQDVRNSYLLWNGCNGQTSYVQPATFVMNYLP